MDDGNLLSSGWRSGAWRGRMSAPHGRFDDPDDHANWPEEVDLLVIGAGAAGMTAAFVASQEGLRVALCEKGNQIGGTTATSGGMIWVPGNEVGANAGHPDAAEDARRYLAAETGANQSPELLDAFVRSSRPAIAYLEKHSQLFFSAPFPNPDYHMAEGFSPGGRAVVPVPFDGRVLGSDFRRVREPLTSLLVLGGMMVARREVDLLLRPFASWRAFTFAAKTVTRYFADRLSFHRGTRLLLGNALAAGLFASLRKNRVPILWNAALTELVVSEDQVVGARLRVAGEDRYIKAKMGVVLATGGFAGSTHWREKLMRHRPATRSLAFEDSDGSGLDAAVQAGGDVAPVGASPVFWAPISILTNKDGSETIWMHGVLDRAKPGFIAVNRQGKRFTNEASSYHDFVNGMFADQGANPCFLMCDARSLNDYGLGLVQPHMFMRLAPFIRANYLVTANTIEGLADRIGVDRDALNATITRHNAFAESGIDEDFGKGTTALNRHNGDPRNAVNPCLRPIRTAPFYAVQLHPGILGTATGIKTDIDGRALRADGAIIPGLYACGNDMNSIMNGNYPGPGITLGPALVFGWRVGMHASQKPVNGQFER